MTTKLSWAPGQFECVINGNFERGCFSGWTVATTGPAEFYVDGGQADPPGPDEPLPPGQGAADALLVAGNNSVACLSQQVVLPAHCRSALLSWNQCVRQGSYDCGYGNYRVELRNTNDLVLKTVFYGDLGNFWDSRWQRWSYDVSQWAASERVLRLVFLMETERGLASLRLDGISLAVQQTDTPSAWEVYLGKQPGLGPSDLVGLAAEPNWQPPPLEPLTTYYWQVAGVTEGRTPGPVWQFTTRGPEHFDWQPIASPQYLSQPFSVTVRARDELNRVVTGYQGTALLSASIHRQQTLFAESFEQTDLSGWDCSDSNYTYAVTTETAAHGARSLRVQGGCGYPCSGISRSFAPSCPDLIRFRVRGSENDIEGGHFHITKGESRGLYFFLGSDGTMGLYEFRDNRYYWYALPYQPGRWYEITFRCDWQAKTVDFCVDGVQVYGRLPLLSDLESLEKLSLYNSGFTRTWWDGIRADLRSRANPGP